MKTISTIDDLAKNLATLQRYLRSNKRSQRTFAGDLIRDGVCFVAQIVEGEQFFAPSRFVGYKQNTMAAHMRSETKDGRVTNLAINSIVGSQPELDCALEQQYQRFCARHAIEPRSKGPFGVERKFWALSAKSEPRRTLATLVDELNAAVFQSLNDDPDARRARLRDAPTKPKRISVSATAFVRNPDVVAEVLLRANGMCERCMQPAPFARRSDGTPYLEVHHIVQLADGGDDTVENVMANCPNCHRRVHYA